MSLNEFNIHNAGYGPCIGTINVEQSSNEIKLDNVKTIIILDVSGSMSSYITHMLNKHIPNAMDRLKYDKITLITFNNVSKVYTVNSSQLRAAKGNSGNRTFMESAVNNLEKIICNCDDNIRILTISDGALHDQVETLHAATKLANIVKHKNIRSSAIRLFTGQEQPDTRGLASILQLNTSDETKLTDLHYTPACNGICDAICDSLTDTLQHTSKLISENPIFMMHPWSEPRCEIYLEHKQNTFWVKNIENVMLMSNNNEVVLEPIMGESLTSNNFSDILNNKVNYYIERLKILKVIDIKDSQNEITEIMNYFNNLDDSLDINEIDDTSTSIKSRIHIIKQRAFRQIKTRLQELSRINNDDKVSQLNFAQQANFLRSATTSSNTVNLAKRGISQGLDFDKFATDEVKNMKEHFDEISGIDDTLHSVSFYSQDTTLGGIRELCQLDDNTLNKMSALDILKLLNIVGMPCDAVVGDFPDPKTYHVKKIFPGTYISMSDIIVCREMKNKLRDPLLDEEIINVIPFYDDDRIQQFLMKYAPTLLEYTASIGMRNMIINIPHTYKYTIVDGAWKMAQILQDNPTVANAEIFTKFVHTYKTAVNHMFDYVLNYIVPRKIGDTLSMCISNNGVTNMISPLITICNDPEKERIIPDILRALYTFEFYQILKKLHRTESDGYIKRKKLLDDLLGIDFDKYSSELPPFFESQKVPAHCDEYHINVNIFNELNNRSPWVDYICKMPTMFKYALANDINSLVDINNTNITKEMNLNINVDIQTFKLYCMYQGLMYDTLVSRYDETNSKMKITDPGFNKLMKKEIGDYIRRQYHSRYQSDLAEQNKQEIIVLTDQLVMDLVKSETVKQFIDLLKNGITKNHVSVKIADMFKAGFNELQAKLFDPNMECPKRKAKLRIFIMACDIEDNVVYNNGNVIKISIATLDKLFENVGCYDMWEKLTNEFIKKSIHIYRNPNIPNRHTHSNEKPSYWAYGYKNLRDYFDNISKHDQDEYCKIHTNCCGVWNGKPVKWA